MEILDEFGPGSFDAVVALDVIEHFDKKDALSLLGIMEKTARKKVIVFTPNGFQPQDPHFGNDLHVHLSGWSAPELASLGFRVWGINGLKILRGNLALPRWRPRPVWGRISLITQLFTRNRPEISYALLGVRDLA